MIWIEDLTVSVVKNMVNLPTYVDLTLSLQLAWGQTGVVLSVSQPHPLSLLVWAVTEHEKLRWRLCHI